MVKRTRRRHRRGGAPADAGPAYPPQHAKCYEGIEWADQNRQPIYFGMYSNDQPVPARVPEFRRNQDRGWFTIEGEESVRRHYWIDSLRVVPCQNQAVDEDVEMEAGRRRRRGRKSRRKSLRQRK